MNYLNTNKVLLPGWQKLDCFRIYTRKEIGERCEKCSVDIREYNSILSMPDLHGTYPLSKIILHNV